MAKRPGTGSGGTPPDPTRLRRDGPGRYASGDGRFVVEQASGGWMVLDAEQTNEFGMPLARGPFGTLDAARAAMDSARSGPAPISRLAERAAALPKRAASGPVLRSREALPEPVIVREFRSSDGPGLRALWEVVGFRSLGDDDAGLQRFAQRNPGTFLVASRAATIIGSALGGWDGRRGWIYHVATAAHERRAGVATQLVHEVERRLHALGCRKVNAVVIDGNADGAAFWERLGYRPDSSRHFGRTLDD